jgi:hypothetical protein
VRWAALLLLALALTGCETTAEKSAKLEKAAERRAGYGQVLQQGLSVSRASAVVKVLDTAVLHDSEGAVAIVTLRNAAGRALGRVPVAITVQNNAPGLEPGLVSVASLPASSEIAWVDDQVPANGAPASVVVRVGEGPGVTGSLPAIDVAGLHVIEDPANGVRAAGTVRNRSAIAQQNVAVYVVARRGGRVVAAGRAVLPEVAAGASTPFQAFLLGSPHGAQLQASAPATTLR